MCGLAGVMEFTASGSDLKSHALEMAARLDHRGPDGRTAWVSPGGRCALGHTRLKVIDLETGDQPMASEDGRVQVVFNGEIYNFRELRSELEAAGHRFKSRSDTEAIVHGYEEWGDELAEHLDGMFALAVWDEGRGRLLLARDRPGKKPLFVYQEEGRLAFASEIKALLALPGADDTLDRRAFPLYLAYGYVPAPGTFYKRVRKLPPASCLSVERDGATREWSYWSLDFTPHEIPESQALERVRELTRAAVERRLVADVPLGAFLSGGVDSTIIVGLMSQAMDEPLRTFAIGFADDPTYDETHFARLAARQHGTEHTSFTVEAQSVELVDELVEAYDEPFGDSSAIPTHVVSRLTREHVTVALTGDGGDEMFAGYPRFLGAQIAAALPGWVVGVGDAVGKILPHSRNFRSLPRRLTRFFEAAGLPADERTLRWIGFFGELEQILRPEALAAVDQDELLRSFREPLKRYSGASELTRMLALNFETYLPEDLLVKADRCSMAHGLELRSPFLDTELMELAASLPDRYRIRGRDLKYLLRRAFQNLLPDAILGRAKMGFGVPLPMWFRNQWRPLLERRVLAADALLWQWLRREPVLEMAEAHFSGSVDRGHQLWALLTLETWLRRRE